MMNLEMVLALLSLILFGVVKYSPKSRKRIERRVGQFNLYLLKLKIINIYKKNHLFFMLALGKGQLELVKVDVRAQMQ